MSMMLRWSGTLAVAALFIGSIEAQTPDPTPPTTGPNRPALLPPDPPAPPGGTARPTAPNVGVVGTPSPGSAYSLPSSTPSAAPPSRPATMPPPGSGSDSSPYSLSTAPGFNPYTNSRAGMGNSPYSMPVDNTPIGGGYTAGMGMGMGLGFGYIPNSAGYGYALMGTADYTRAAGQYWKDIQQARFAREQVSQMQLETARRRVQYEAWYETMRPTAPKMRDAEMATDLDRARKDPPDSEVTSGRALNVLLRSIQAGGRASSGPAIAIDEETTKHINLSGGTTSGNVGMLKGGVNLNWPDSLLDSGFDESRKRITRNLKNAVETLKDREPVSPALRRDIQADFKTLNEKLNESANDLSPAQYIEARRFMNQLNGSIKALSDPKASNFFGSWTAKGKTVGELVENMTREGLTFSSAAPGDESYYRALYQGLRAFELSLQSGSR